MTPLHRMVAGHDYALPWFVLFLVVRLAQIFVVVYLGVRVFMWGVG